MLSFFDLGFWILVGVTVIIFWCLSSSKARKVLITMLSIGYYLLSDPLIFGVLLGSMVVDFWIVKSFSPQEIHHIGEEPEFNPFFGTQKDAHTLEIALPLKEDPSTLPNQREHNKSKRLFFTGILWNLVLFLLPAWAHNQNYSIFNPLLEFFNTTLAIQPIILFIGISYFSFQSIAYLSEGYYHRLPSHSFWDLCLYLFYFPKILAGPLEPPQKFFAQFEATQESNTFDYAHFAKGITLICLGFLKKIAIANIIALKIAPIMIDPAIFGEQSRFWIIWLYSIQLYCDFSGYSLIARGISLLYGIELQKNFTQPYRSRNSKEFWNRWHISLSKWIREYIYIPCGGNRKGKARKYANLLLSMIVIGLWHGRTLNFFLWGVIHGILLVISHLLSENNQKHQKESHILGKILSIGLNFILISWLWILFFSASLGDAWLIFSSQFQRIYNSSLLTFDLPQIFIYGAIFSLSLDFLESKWDASPAKIEYSQDKNKILYKTQIISETSNSVVTIPSISSLAILIVFTIIILLGFNFSVITPFIYTGF